MEDESLQGTITWRELLAETVARLSAEGIDDAEISARRIVEEACGWEGADLGLHLSDRATKRGVAHLDAMVARRLTGEPLQYVVGRWSFRMLDLMVDSRALIPRPETEEVAGWAIDEAHRIASPRRSPDPTRGNSGGQTDDENGVSNDREVYTETRQE